MKLHSNIEFVQDAVSFWLVHETAGEAESIGKPVEMVPCDVGLMVEPTFRLRTSEAQEMFEQLWKQGFRSKHDNGNSEALDAARREHIDDLRRAAKLDRGAAK